MTEELERKLDQGCTIERRRHGSIVTEARMVTKGGALLSAGNRDTEHCLLDCLRNSGALGGHEDAEIRYETGYKLRELYFSFRVSGPQFSGGVRGTPSPFTSEADIGNEQDLAETFFNRVMNCLPAKYRIPVKNICVENVCPAQADLVVDSLDALYGAFCRAEKPV